MDDAITGPETPIDLLRLIASYGDNVFPNLCAVLQILLTVGVSVASYERSFSSVVASGRVVCDGLYKSAVRLI